MAREGSGQGLAHVPGRAGDLERRERLRRRMVMPFQLRPGHYPGSPNYPESAGWKEPDTSKDAAEAVEGSGKARTLRAEVLRVLRTSEEMLAGSFTNPIDVGGM